MTHSGPLVLVHGFTGLPDVWSEVIAQLPAGVKVCCPLLGGHGGARFEGKTFEDEVDRIAEQVLREVGKGAHLCGYSLGGRIGFGLLVRHPAIFSGATLVGAHPGLEDDAQRRTRVAADDEWAEVLERDGVAAFLEAWQALPLFASQSTLPEEVRAKQRRWRLAHEATGLAQAMRTLSLGRMPPWGPRLRDVRVRVRLVVGALDDRFEPLATWAASRLPHGEVRRVADSGHNVVLERPSELVALLRQELPS